MQKKKKKNTEENTEKKHGKKHKKSQKSVLVYRLKHVISRVLKLRGRRRHRRRVVLHDGPPGRALGVSPEREAETRALLLGLAVCPLPRERVCPRLRREVAVDAHRHRGVLRQSQLGKPRKVVLFESISGELYNCLLYTSPSPRDKRQSRMPSSA